MPRGRGAADEGENEQKQASPAEGEHHGERGLKNTNGPDARGDRRPGPGGTEGSGGHSSVRAVAVW
jgi:hypothetical protein